MKKLVCLLKKLPHVLQKLKRTSMICSLQMMCKDDRLSHFCRGLPSIITHIEQTKKQITTTIIQTKPQIATHIDEIKQHITNHIEQTKQLITKQLEQAKSNISTHIEQNRPHPLVLSPPEFQPFPPVIYVTHTLPGENHYPPSFNANPPSAGPGFPVELGKGVAVSGVTNIHQEHGSSVGLEIKNELGEGPVKEKGIGFDVHPQPVLQPDFGFEVKKELGVGPVKLEKEIGIAVNTQPVQQPAFGLEVKKELEVGPVKVEKEFSLNVN